MNIWSYTYAWLTGKSFLESPKPGFAVLRQKLNSKRTKLTGKKKKIHYLKRKKGKKKKEKKGGREEGSPTITTQALKRFTQWNYFSNQFQEKRPLKLEHGLKKKKRRNSIIAVSNLSAMKKYQNAVSFDHVIVFIKFHHLWPLCH